MIELGKLSAWCGFADVAEFQRAHRQWVAEALLHEARKRDEHWSEALAVGSQAFVEKVGRELAVKAKHRDVDEADGTYSLREPARAYMGLCGTENGVLRSENAIFWERNSVNPCTWRGPTRDWERLGETEFSGTGMKDEEMPTDAGISFLTGRGFRPTD